MIKFYTGTLPAPDDKTVQVPFLFDDTYQATSFYTIDRPAGEEDKAAYPDAYAAYLATLPQPEPVDPVVTDPSTPVTEPTQSPAGNV